MCFTVSNYADKFENPRWMYVLSNSDVLEGEANSNHSSVEKIGGKIIGASKANNLSHSTDVITLIKKSDKYVISDLRTISFNLPMYFEKIFTLSLTIF